MLLEAGADANDAQAIYNRGLGDVARDDTDFLALLLEHGLGRGDGGPWYRLLAPGGSTRDLLGEALQHAAESGLLARTGLLLGYGADPNGRGSHPVFRNRTAYQGAVLHGHTRLAEMLEAAGAEVESIDPITRFVGACLAGDRHELDLRHSADPLLAATVRRRHPDLISRAAELGRPEAIRLLVELGYDVNHRGRTTALHEAAYRGHDRVVVELLELGADPTVEDIEHHSTPEGWARFAGHAATAATLAEAVSRWRGSVG